MTGLAFGGLANEGVAVAFPIAEGGVLPGVSVKVNVVPGDMDGKTVEAATT